MHNSTKKNLCLASLVALFAFPTVVVAGSITYSTPGTYSLTIPWYATISATVNGAGGGGGGTDQTQNESIYNGSAGGASYFRTLTTDSSFDLIGYGGAAGTGGWVDFSFYDAPCGETTCSYYTFEYVNGSAGAHGSWTGYGASGSTGGGAAGGAGGSHCCYGFPPLGGTGGNGGNVSRSWSKGQSYAPVYNSTITIIVGSGGAGGAASGGDMPGSTGSNGSVTVTWTDGPAPTCSISVAANPINSGQSTTLSWSSTDIPGGWFYITNVGYVSGSGSTTVAPSTTTTYDGTVSGPGGSGNCSRTLTVNPAASVDVSANPTSLSYGGSSTISWSGSNITQCTMAGGTWGSGTSVSTSGSGSSGALTATTTFTFSCKYSYDTSQTLTDTQEVSVAIAPAPSCSTFSANPTAITQGNSSTISWTCSNATSCTGSGTGFSTSGATSGTDPVSPTVTTQYALSCTGAGGTTNISPITVTVSCAAIYSCSGDTIQYTNASCETSNVTTCTSPYYCSAGSSSCLYPQAQGGLSGGGSTAIRVTPRFVRSGNTATVNWDVDNANTCTVSGNGNSWTGASGSRTSNPVTQQSTYTVICDDLDEDATQDDFAQSAAVYVLPKWLESRF